VQHPLCHTYTPMCNTRPATPTHPCATPSMPHLHTHVQHQACHPYTPTCTTQYATPTHPCAIPSMPHLHNHVQHQACHTYTPMCNTKSGTFKHPAFVYKKSRPDTAIFRLRFLTPKTYPLRAWPSVGIRLHCNHLSVVYYCVVL